MGFNSTTYATCEHTNTKTLGRASCDDRGRGLYVSSQRMLIISSNQQELREKKPIPEKKINFACTVLIYVSLYNYERTNFYCCKQLSLGEFLWKL